MHFGGGVGGLRTKTEKKNWYIKADAYKNDENTELLSNQTNERNEKMHATKTKNAVMHDFIRDAILEITV